MFWKSFYLLFMIVKYKILHANKASISFHFFSFGLNISYFHLHFLASSFYFVLIFDCICWDTETVLKLLWKLPKFRPFCSFQFVFFPCDVLQDYQKKLSHDIIFIMAIIITATKDCSHLSMTWSPPTLSSITLLIIWVIMRLLHARDY